MKQTQQAASLGNYQVKRGAGFDSEAFMRVEHMPNGCGQDFFERTDMFMFKFLESLATTAPAVGAPVASLDVSAVRNQLRASSSARAAFDRILAAVSSQPAASAEGVTDARKELIGDIEFIVDEWRENGEVNAEGALSRIASALDDATLAAMKARHG